MKMPLFVALAALALPAMPASAQSLSDTHDLVWATPGKSHPPLFRMKSRPACAVAGQPHLSGKMQFHAPAVTEECAALLAAKRVAPRGLAVGSAQ